MRTIREQTCLWKLGIEAAAGDGYRALMHDGDLQTTAEAQPAWQTQLGLAVTVIWLAVAAIYSWHVWPNLLSLKPDEFATFLGGVFAPLAFLWLVVGYFQQGQELRHSVEALRLQSLELRDSVEQQRELVGATREQIEHERAVATAAEHSAIKAAAPKFLVKNEGFSAEEATIGVWFKLFNVGQRCTNVRLLIEPYGYEEQFADFPSSRSFSLYLAVNIRAEFCAQQFILEYRDIRGDSGVQRLHLAVREDSNGGSMWDTEAVMIEG